MPLRCRPQRPRSSSHRGQVRLQDWAPASARLKRCGRARPTAADLKTPRRKTAKARGQAGQKDKRVAMRVEDHPLSHAAFEGTIPPKQYGAGKVIVWDEGHWAPLGDPRAGLRDGNLKFELHGHKLQGRWVLVRMKGWGGARQAWVLIKEKDGFARPSREFSVVDEAPGSVKLAPAASGTSTRFAQPTSGTSATRTRAWTRATIRGKLMPLRREAWRRPSRCWADPAGDDGDCHRRPNLQAEKISASRSAVLRAACRSRMPTPRPAARAAGLPAIRRGSLGDHGSSGEQQPPRGA